MQTSSQNQFAKMLQMFDRMEKNFKKPKDAHGKGSVKGPTSKKHSISESEDECSDEANAKKLKVPFRAGEDPDAAAAASNSGC